MTDPDPPLKRELVAERIAAEMDVVARLLLAAVMCWTTLDVEGI